MALFQRLTPLEMAVLDAVASKLEVIDASHLRAQVKAAVIARNAIGRVVTFSYPLTHPPVLSGNASAIVAIVSVRGVVSGFTTTARLQTNEGILSTLLFQTAPWDGDEPFEITLDFSRQV